MPRLTVDVSEVPWVYVRRPGLDRISDDAGYVYLWDEPSRRYVAEHRLVAARALGRPLRTDEQVHHLDGRKYHNSSRNLVVCDPDYHEYLDYKMRAARARARNRLATVKDEEKRASLWLRSRRVEGELSSRLLKLLKKWDVSIPPPTSNTPKPPGS